ncbi:3-oxoacyl-[acyl-carrier-protein] reductase FabG [Halotydeus destructor]|nr:3-oxoacyl-[acyl-carrier-protein] reductase FabG [Halotydeus destructor]
MSDLEFDGKVVLVTDVDAGSASGIGRSTADLFAAKGANLILCDLNETGLKQASDDIVSKYGVEVDTVDCHIAVKFSNILQVHSLAGDLTNRSVLEKLIQDGVAKFGRLDVLVNNAGVSSNSCPADDPNCMVIFDKIMAVNIRAAYQLSSIASPYLIASQGNIVNVSSIFATTACKNYSAYCVSKAAISMMTQCLAFELGMKGVRVNEVRPTFTDTPMMAPLVVDEAETEAVWKLLRNFTPLRKTAVPADIAEAIAHLASSGQDMANGLSYSVDAGFNVRGIAFD